MKALAWLRLWWHCLLRFHRMMSAWDEHGHTLLIRCGDCEYIAWVVDQHHPLAGAKLGDVIKGESR